MTTEINIACTECDDVDFTVGMTSLGISISGTRERTDEALADMKEEPPDCAACGGEVEITEVRDGE